MTDEELANIKSEDEVKRTEIPREVPILPLRDTVIYPFMVTPLVVARPKSVQLINDVVVGDRILGLVAQKQAEIEDPGPDDIYEYGTVATVLKMLKFPDGSLRVL
ncbi:MAG TPA: endopeptidase La, partial [Bacteroidetes bacterium]|nr:endopeptidase La [Bacteroidota bacterium]